MQERFNAGSTIARKVPRANHIGKIVPYPPPSIRTHTNYPLHIINLTFIVFIDAKSHPNPRRNHHRNRPRRPPTG
jgi:hypothetical protein